MPFIVLPLTLIITPEYKNWHKLELQTGDAGTMIPMVLAFIALSKFLDRTSKFSIVHSASTLFYAVVDANMKVVAGVGAFFFFGEELYWPQYLGFVLIICSLIISIFNRRLQLNASSRESESVNIEDSGNVELFCGINSDEIGTKSLTKTLNYEELAVDSEHERTMAESIFTDEEEYSDLKTLSATNL